MKIRKSETPDSSLFCRASAQDGDSDTRESASLSPVQLPKTAKHQTARLCVGRQPRTVTQIPESPLACRLIGYRKPQNTRQTRNSKEKSIGSRRNRCFLMLLPEKHPYQRNGHNDLHGTNSQPVQHGFGAFFDDVGEFNAHADCGEGGDFELGADGF